MSNVAEESSFSIEKLKKSQITAVSLDPMTLRARFDFILGSDPPYYKLEFIDVVYFSFSKSFGDEDANARVYDITLSDTTTNSKAILKSLGYAWRDENGDPFVNTSDPVYHLHIEGDICFDVVCTKYIVMKSM